MRFWDSSAVVPLVAAEESSAWVRGLLRSDPRGMVWALSPVEVRSALVRKEREGTLSLRESRTARRRADAIFAALSEVAALDLVAARALRLLDTHALRAADAMQLAAALVASRERPQGLPFVTLDERLAAAAEREGFPVPRAET